MSTEHEAAHDGASTNGHRIDDGKVRVAIVGVGNCANAFIQGVTYYKDADPAEQVPGLMHVDLGGYHVRDIEFVAAFDIDAEKVGKDLSEAIWSGQNDTIKFADVPRARSAGPSRHDPRRARQVPEGEDHQGARADRRHRRHPPGDEGRRPGLLPAGRLRAGDQVVRRAGAQGGRRVRQLPARVHRPRGLLGRALQRGRACRSSATTSSRRSGATIVHRQLARLFHDRGVRLERTSQLNVGGNMDFYNMLERERLASKKESKTNAVTSIMGHELPADDVHVGPSDYVRLADRPQVGPHQARGPLVRRRAAEPSS